MKIHNHKSKGYNEDRRILVKPTPFIRLRVFVRLSTLEWSSSSVWCDKVDLVSATFTRSWTSPKPQVEMPIPPLPFGAKSPGEFLLVYKPTNHLLWFLDPMVTPVSSALNSQRTCHQRLWATESALCCTHPKSKICITNDWHHICSSKYSIFFRETRII